MVIVVDDDDADRHLVGEAVVEAGLDIELILLRGGAELFAFIDQLDEHHLEAIRQDRCLVLLDLNMPRMSGLDVLDRLKRDALLNAIPVVMFTTSNSPHDRSRCLERGASGYVVKPMTFTDLVDLLRATIGVLGPGSGDRSGDGEHPPAGH
ncbi:MAG: response regulator [Planctomycetes bacterium]|nr:response regulator [Planctomycetota bacterium]